MDGDSPVTTPNSIQDASSCWQSRAPTKRSLSTEVQVAPLDAFVDDRTQDVSSVYDAAARPLVDDAAYGRGPTLVKVRPLPSSTTQHEGGHQTYMNLSVVVCVCFNLPIGMLAFLVSLKSSTSFKEGNIAGGHARARCSLILSMLGIVVTVSTVMAVVFYIASKNREMQYRYG